MPMMMDAIVKSSAQKGLELVRKEIPKITYGEALVKIHYTAICGTDVHIYDWNDWAQKNINPPLTIGHEFVGEIVEIKGYADNFKVGDIVSAEGHVNGNLIIPLPGKIVEGEGFIQQCIQLGNGLCFNLFGSGDTLHMGTDLHVADLQHVI